MHRLSLVLFIFYMLIVSKALRSLQRPIQPGMSTQLHSLLRDRIEENAFNSVRDHLTPDPEEASFAQHIARNVLKAHYCNVTPEPVSSPKLVAASASCLESLHLPSNAAEDPLFTSIFSGNALTPGLDTPYSTNYGCHRYCMSSFALIDIVPLLSVFQLMNSVF